MTIPYTSIYTDADGETHFREGQIATSEKSIGALIPPLGASATYHSETCYFLTFAPGMFADWHPAPGRLLHLFLAGECEVQVSDGAVRVFREGEIVLAEDTSGKGHTTANHGEGQTLMVVVRLAEGLAL